MPALGCLAGKKGRLILQHLGTMDIGLKHLAQQQRYHQTPANRQKRANLFVLRQSPSPLTLGFLLQLAGHPT